MSEWIYFIDPPRTEFASTMNASEVAAFQAHFERFERLLADGVLILAGPTTGVDNIGVAVFEAEDEAAAQAVVDADPVVAAGIATARLYPFRVSLLRGRD